MPGSKSEQGQPHESGVERSTKSKAAAAAAGRDDNEGPSDGTTVSLNGMKNVLKEVLEGFQQKEDSRMDQIEG